MFTGEALDASLKGLHSVLDSSHAAVAATDHCLVLLPQEPCRPVDEAAASSKHVPQQAGAAAAAAAAPAATDQAVMVLFKFGAVTFFNAPKWQEAALLQQLRPLTTNPVMKPVDQLEQEGTTRPAWELACTHDAYVFECVTQA